jgi:SDR family mycofactocin-dependent oxidoreductase
MSAMDEPARGAGAGGDHGVGADGHDGPGAPVALVTGGARGIGATIGRQLAAAGWRVALLDACADEPALSYELASQADLDAAVAAARRESTTAATTESVIGLVADVRDQRAIDAAVADAVAHFGRLDAVVSAAGAIAGGPTAWETDDVVWDAMLAINLTGPWRLVRAAVPHLLAAPAPRRGRIVVISSAASTDGLPRLAAYTAAKHGVAGLVKSLAVELGHEGITVNAVAPGSTRTAMLDASAAVYDLGSVEEFVAHQPLGRLIEPAEIAAAVVWLCSAGASGLTGAIIPVDGGMTAT